MASETTITIVGNLIADPELRPTRSGTDWVTFTIASTPRTYNRQSNQYEDGDTLFMRCSAWRDLATHCGSSLKKGMRVIAQGRLRQRSYQANDGSNRTVVEMTVDEIGPSLRYATAIVTRQSSGNGGFAGRNQGGYGGNGGGNSGGISYQGGGSSFGGGQSGAPAGGQQPAADPWSSGSDSGNSFSTFGGTSDFGGGDSDDDPPF